MSATPRLKGMMKWPLIVAAVLVLVRIPLELAGAPESITNIFGVAWLYFLVPVYFALRIADAGDVSPFKSLLKNLVTFNFLTRLMVMPTYWLAYAFGWAAPRFALNNGGVVGDGVTPFEGILVVPVRNLLAWVVVTTIVGMVLGGIVLAVKRRQTATAA